MLKRTLSMVPTLASSFLFSSKTIKVPLPKMKTHLLPKDALPSETTTDREELLHVFK